MSDNSAVFPVSHSRRMWIMGVMLLSSLLASLDSSFVPIAFPDMIDDLKTSTGVVVWVALGYLVAATGPMLLSARIGDRVGQARMFQLGTAVYAIAMVLCTWAPDIESLIALRLVQGLGMAIFLPSTFAIAAMIYPQDQRGKALGLLQAANAFGFVLGPVFAGFLLDAYDWRAIFAARIPLAALAIVLSLVAFGVAQPFRTSTVKRPNDLLGAVLLTLALFGLLFGLTRIPVEDNHLDVWMWLVLVGGALLLWLFVKQEKRAQAPLIDFSLFANSRFTKASIAFAALFASFPIYLFTLPIVLVNGLEIRSWTVGMVLAVVAVCTMVVSPMAGRHAERFGPERLCSVGVIMLAAGYVLLALLQADSSVYYLILPLVLIGVGAGLFFTPNNYLLMSSAPADKLAMVSGLIGTFRQVGYSVGFAIAASLFTVVQNMFESNWTYVALAPLEADSAIHIAHLFDSGGPWSSEVLLYVLRLTAIVCIATLVLSFVNVIPKLKMSALRHNVVLAASLVLAVLGSYVFSAVSTVSLNTSNVDVRELSSVPAATAFGWSHRAAVPIQPPQSLDGKSLYDAQCMVCHGPSAEGVKGLGVALAGNAFVQQSEAVFQTFIAKGRQPQASDSRTGRLMPGFANLAEADVAALQAFLKSQAKPGKG